MLEQYGFLPQKICEIKLNRPTVWAIVKVLVVVDPFYWITKTHDQEKHFIYDYIN